MFFAYSWDNVMYIEVNQLVNSYFPDGLKITLSWTIPDQAMNQQVMSR